MDCDRFIDHYPPKLRKDKYEQHETIFFIRFRRCLIR
jgi:hypothetical protein